MSISNICVCIYIYTHVSVYIDILKMNCSVIPPPLGKLSSTAGVVQSY